MQALNLKTYEELSPFEVKDELIRLARCNAKKAAHAFLNAGRGNPNWIATEPRNAFFLLGHFGIAESERILRKLGIGGMPAQQGIAERLLGWLDAHSDLPGTAFVRRMLPYVEEAFGFEADAFVHELIDAIIGDNYPVPDRMLFHAERVVRRYLDWAMCGARPPAGAFDLFAVEGGTAAICYVFKSLTANRILKRGDTIAIATPIFTPYLEIAALEDYALDCVYLDAAQENGFQFTDSEIRKLEDPKVKAVFLVNPGNPTSVARSPETNAKLVRLVHEKRPNLIVLTDDVYGTFVKGFRSLMAELPHNTIGVYSYSKYFGCTGWRLGVIALHENNVLDEMVARLPEDDKRALDKRYGSLTLEPRKLRMIDRLVADSRDVALNHTAGLSLPQQAMMILMSICELTDTAKDYQARCMDLLARRVDACVKGLDIDAPRDAYFASYYGEIDFEFWLKKYLGDDMVDWMKRHIHPLDIVFRLAEDYGIVVLNGSGFKGPDWSCRVSFANLNGEVYDDIGHALRSVAHGYVQAYRASHAMPHARIGDVRDPAMPEPVGA